MDVQRRALVFLKVCLHFLEELGYCCSWSWEGLFWWRLMEVAGKCAFKICEIGYHFIGKCRHVVNQVIQSFNSTANILLFAYFLFVKCLFHCLAELLEFIFIARNLLQIVRFFWVFCLTHFISEDCLLRGFNFLILLLKWRDIGRFFRLFLILLLAVG